MNELPRCRRVDWAETERWADTLAARLRAAGPLPETVVALTRGGWVPARLVADRLGLRRLVALRAQHWGVTATKSGRAELTEELSGPVAGQRVLVLDDITDTGESLELATRHVRERGAAEVRSATFLHISHSRFVPTFFAEEIARDAWVWVVFPWNYWEDLDALVGRARTADAEPSAIARRLAEACGLAVPLADVVRVLAGEGRRPGGGAPAGASASQ
jgi:uncharacterized protein